MTLAQGTFFGAETVFETTCLTLSIYQWNENMNIRYYRLRFYRDPMTGLPHIYNHNVVESEVEDVLRNPGEDRPARDGSRVAIGQTQNGRYLRVIYTPDPRPGSAFVITAYELTGKPLAAYKRRQRRRGRP